jgi:hypothetical protein
MRTYCTVRGILVQGYLYLGILTQQIGTSIGGLVTVSCNSYFVTLAEAKLIVSVTTFLSERHTKSLLVTSLFVTHYNSPQTVLARS